MLKCIYDNNVAEESEEAKQEKMAKIKRKLEAGKKLTKEELSWLQRNDPIAYAHAFYLTLIYRNISSFSIVICKCLTASSEKHALRVSRVKKDIRTGIFPDTNVFSGYFS